MPTWSVFLWMYCMCGMKAEVFLFRKRRGLRPDAVTCQQGLLERAYSSQCLAAPAGLPAVLSVQPRGASRVLLRWGARAHRGAQGRTSRWGLAWSFMVQADSGAAGLPRPVTAARPVPRQASLRLLYSTMLLCMSCHLMEHEHEFVFHKRSTAHARMLRSEEGPCMRARRRASFSVRSPRGGAPQILATLAVPAGGAGRLGRRGSPGLCSGGRRCQIRLLPQTTAAAGWRAACKGVQSMMRPVGGIGNSNEVCKSNNSNIDGGDDGGMARKRQKRSGVSSSREESDAGQEDGAYVLQLTLMQESKSTCIATASIATSASDKVAGRFTMLCKMLETDVAQMLG